MREDVAFQPSARRTTLGVDIGMIAYASRTGTARNLARLRNAGWHLLVSARGVLRTEGFPYALDNGAWTAFQRGEPFDDVAFSLALRKLGRNAEWVVLPDIVAGGPRSLELSLSWMPQVLDHTDRVLLAVQDGMQAADVEGLLGNTVGIFVGGSTEWKLSTLPAWGRLRGQSGCWLHVGRVNSAHRIYACGLAGASSFDGTSATRWACTLPMLDSARRQMVLPGGLTG
jgi:hypothetical protein